MISVTVFIDKEKAEPAVALLLQERLAAQVCVQECAGIFRVVKGSVKEAGLTMLVAETRALLFERLVEALVSRFGNLEIHSAPVTHFNEQYANLVKGKTVRSEG